MRLRAAFVPVLLTSLALCAMGCGSDDADSTKKTAGTAGSSGSSGTSGTSGAAGSVSGTSGTAGTGALAGASGEAGTAGESGTGGTGGTAGTGAAAGAAGTGGTSGTAGTTAGASGASTDYPAPHQDPPQVVSYGGNVLSAPKVYPVYFANDDTLVTNKLTEFFEGVGSFMVGDTTYWSAATSEYGVGPLTSGDPIQLTEDAPASIQDSAIQTWLKAKFNSNDPAFPTPDANIIVALVYPSVTTITLQGEQSCQTFGGYHQEIKLDAAHQNRKIAYAVLPRCPGDPLDTQYGVTPAASHELIEAATDPTPNLDPAYASVDDPYFAWSITLGGGEVGDLCAQNPSSFLAFPGFNFGVQRSWSNASVMAGHDPCVPIPVGSGSYFNAVPVLDDVPVNFGQGQSGTLKAVSIPVGQSKTIDVQLFSDGPTDGPWKVKALDPAEFTGGTTSLTFTFDKDTGVNGDVLHLTINSTHAAQYKLASFLLSSSSGNTRNFWIGTVVQ